MKKTLLNIHFLFAAMIGLLSNVSAQNWQYVTAPYIAQNSSFSVYFYYPDLEFNSSGDAIVGYYEYSGTIHVATNIGGSWNQLPAPATGFTVNALDIEVHNTDYYCAYSRVISSNMYVFVKKFDGTTWNQLGDSMLLGNSGSGGYFEFVVDNNGVPTILGAVNAVSLANKEIRQFNGTDWNLTYTISNSAATLFREGTAIFNSQNKLICISQTQSATLINEIDGGQQSLLTDTIHRTFSVNKIMLDANDVAYLCSNNPITNYNYIFKQNGPSWNFIGDTTSASVGTLLSAAVSDDGTVIYNTLQSNLFRSIYYVNNNLRIGLDSVNISGFGIGTISKLFIPRGSSEVYAAIIEIRSSAAQDVSIVKHALPPPNAINEINAKINSLVYPNPISNSGIIHLNSSQNYNGILTITNSLGQICRSQKISSNDIAIDRADLKEGTYQYQVKSENKVIASGKFLVQ